MATNYKIRLKRFNGTDYDTLNLISDNIIMSSGNNLQTDFNELDSAIDDIVYVGDSAPIDPDVKIWLDTDAIGVSAVNSVNGKAGTVILDAEDVRATAWDLLWTNASPTSTFTAQTIILDLSDYDFVVIQFHPNSTSTAVIYRPIRIIQVGTNDLVMTTLNLVTSGYMFNVARDITVNIDNIIFSDGYNKPYQSNMIASIENNRFVPLNIWGIKGVTT